MMIVSLCCDTVLGTQLLYRNGIILQEARRGHCPSVIKVCGLGRETTISTWHARTRNRSAWASAMDFSTVRFLPPVHSSGLKMRENEEELESCSVCTRSFCFFQVPKVYNAVLIVFQCKKKKDHIIIIIRFFLSIIFFLKQVQCSEAALITAEI